MARIPPIFQKIFAGGIAPTGEIAQPGSTALGAPVYTNDPAVIQALAAWLTGLESQLVNAPGGLSSPVMEEMNAILYLITLQLAYFKQGIAEWDVNVTYFAGNMVQDGTGVLWVSNTDNNTGNALAVGANWKTYASTLLGASDPLLKAWVTFDGRTGAILAAFNVSGVARTAAGCYLLTFGAAMPNTNYGFTGSAGTGAGQAYLQGDDNHITGGVPGKVSTKTVTQLTVFCYDRGSVATEDSSCITIQICGP